MAELLFAHPEPTPQRPRLWPVFLPQHGCGHVCLYCHQPSLSGQARSSLGRIYEKLRLDLETAARNRQGPFELGFFGGTFTALPNGWPEKFIELAASFKPRGLITRLRCSTSPAAVGPAQLELLSGLGLDMVELGVQSFHPGSLELCRRGYGPDTAVSACRMIKESGLGLGMQLMPGLPGQGLAEFRRDIELTLELAPQVLRLYPCQVIEGTGLADFYRQGRFQPWSLGRCQSALAWALLRLWPAGISCSRLGLAAEPAFLNSRLAGPWHPGLGSQARGLALFMFLRGIISRTRSRPLSLEVPLRHQGEFWGQAGGLKPRYARLGLLPGTVSFVPDPLFRLIY